MTLPTGFGYATIRGKYISAVLDSADSDREPDVVPLSGLTITLTPSAAGSLLKSLDDPPVTIVLMPIVARTDATGVIVGPDGQPGIVIVAGDYPDPAHPWTYSVSVVGNGFPKMSFNIVALSGETIDLTSVLEAPTNTTDLSAWTALATQVHVDAALAEAAAEASTGPTGGATGQVLAKASDADFDTEWIDPPAGTGGGAVDSVAGRTGVVTLTADDLTDATALGKALARAVSATAARSAIGAGTSNVVIGTTAGTAADAAAIAATLATGLSGKEPTIASGTQSQYYRGDKTWQTLPVAPVTSVNGDTGDVVLTAADVGAADATATATALAGKEPTVAAGTSGQYYDGTKTWKDFPTGGAVTADSITDATVVGKSLVRATDAATARTAIGAGTSNLAVGTTAGTALAGNTPLVQIGTSAGTAADAATVAAALAGKEPTVSAGTTAQYYRGDKTWQNLPPAPVTSVNGDTGAVTLTASDVGAADATATTAALAGKEPNLPAGGTVSQYLRGDKSWQNLPSAPVSSVNSRTGAVTLTSADVGLSNVQNLAVYVLAVGDPDPTGVSPAGLYVRETS